jgi:hypothetical protein
MANKATFKISKPLYLVINILVFILIFLLISSIGKLFGLEIDSKMMCGGGCDFDSLRGGVVCYEAYPCGVNYLLLSIYLLVSLFLLVSLNLARKKLKK